MKRADHHLVQQVLDGDVSQETFAHFQQRLRAEPELLKLYEDYALLHHTLHEEFESGTGSVAAPAGAGGRRFRLPWLLAVAAALTLIFIAWLFIATFPISRPIQRIPADVTPDAEGLGRFKPVVSGPFEKSRWRVDYGNPAITGTRIEGANYSAFLRLPEPVPVRGASVMLATLDVGKSERGEFHTDGWSGMSFFSEGREMLFFGDSYGTGPVWSLDVKQGIPVIVPEHPVRGPAMITLRYDPRTGAVSLHEGGVPLKPAFCSGTIVPGTRFDEIRIGASAGAALAVKSIHIRVNAD